MLVREQKSMVQIFPGEKFLHFFPGQKWVRPSVFFNGIMCGTPGIIHKNPAQSGPQIGFSQSPVRQDDSCTIV
jgi:hypothetical protein